MKFEYGLHRIGNSLNGTRSVFLNAADIDLCGHLYFPESTSFATGRDEAA